MKSKVKAHGRAKKGSPRKPVKSHTRSKSKRGKKSSAVKAAMRGMGGGMPSWMMHEGVSRVPVTRRFSGKSKSGPRRRK